MVRWWDSQARTEAAEGQLRVRFVERQKVTREDEDQLEPGSEVELLQGTADGSEKGAILLCVMLCEISLFFKHLQSKNLLA